MNQPTTNESFKASLLLVDDDYFIRRFLETFFKHHGFKVLTAEDGQQALEIAKDQPLDIIVLDTMMPVMDGFQFIKCLREEHKKETLVLSLTSMETKTSEQDLLKAGVDDVLFKPIDHDILLNKVFEMLKLSNNNNRR